MTNPLGPGMRVNNFCAGAFGRDSYGEKLIIAAGTWNGKNWAVAEDESIGLVFAESFEDFDAKRWLVSE